MRLSAVVNCAAFVSMLSFAGAAGAATEPLRVSGPVTHENLSIYFIHGPSQKGPVPLTLEEALRDGKVQVRETGNVNSLEIENLGDQPVFVQAGDIVKGGKQDRTLTVSLLLPPKSGRMPIGSFCFEHGRWSPRAAENASKFDSAAAVVPSHEMKLAMQAPVPAAAPDRPGNEVGIRQRQVWDSVARTQHRLTTTLGGEVRAKISESSLQLALENEKLLAARDRYVKALKAAGDKDDIVGFVFAINGKLNSGDVYPSHALFAKMWTKLLDASATEAVGLRNQPADEAPTVAMVDDFLAKADAGKTSEQPLKFGMARVLSDADAGYRVEARVAQGWVHRSYLAK